MKKTIMKTFSHVISSANSWRKRNFDTEQFPRNKKKSTYCLQLLFIVVFRSLPERIPHGSVRREVAHITPFASDFVDIEPKHGRGCDDYGDRNQNESQVFLLRGFVCVFV